jgi:hypothetical protein
VTNSKRTAELSTNPAIRAVDAANVLVFPRISIDQADITGIAGQPAMPRPHRHHA